MCQSAEEDVAEAAVRPSNGHLEHVMFHRCNDVKAAEEVAQPGGEPAPKEDGNQTVLPQG